MKVKTSKGFTLAELLIVMAIIVVLAAIAIPTFTKQLETARESGDAELIRAVITDAFTQAYMDYTSGKGLEAGYPIDRSGGSDVVGTEVAFTQTQAGFQYVRPTFKVGTGEVEVGSKEKPVGSATTQQVVVVFKEEAATSSGGATIKLTDIWIGTKGGTVTSADTIKAAA